MKGDEVVELREEYANGLLLFNNWQIHNQSCQIARMYMNYCLPLGPLSKKLLIRTM
ncbi:hypothetical protein Uis4E_0400 [Bifidobacterium parmae]|uniref:Uncharacterized protein n=1 Tax=Bifidobacterium parmae TaxID=361854 RepID=A0A2N5J5P6_9BIFI|nr:hypothetical protein Uis4E_0400 [Bifidobacterium parmae]